MWKDGHWLTDPAYKGSGYGAKQLHTPAQRLAMCQRVYPKMGVTSVSATPIPAGKFFGDGVWPCDRSWDTNKCRNSKPLAPGAGFCQAGPSNCGRNGKSVGAYLCLTSSAVVQPPPSPPPPSPPSCMPASCMRGDDRWRLVPTSLSDRGRHSVWCMQWRLLLQKQMLRRL